jgi:hypothetical protein
MSSKRKAAAKKTAKPIKKAEPTKKAGPKKAEPKKAEPKKARQKGKGDGESGRPARGRSAGGRQAPKLRPVGERAEIGSVPPPPPSSRRNFGLRGAAPWVARHAAKHAEELRKRNAEPPPPGSARATLRTPKEADAIKNKISQLHQRTSKIRALRKRLDKTFFEIGLLLDEIQRLDLHIAKGYSSFESFLDREVELPRSVSLRLVRFTHTFQRDTAYDFGIDRLTLALAALDGELAAAAPPSHPSSRGWSSAALPVKPPIRFED